MTAVATGNKQQPPEATAIAVQGQAQGQKQGQAQQQKQAQQQQQANVQESSSSVGDVTFNEGDFDLNFDAGDQSISLETNNKSKRQAPSVWAPSINPTHPCIVPITGGISVPGAGGSFGKGKEDHNCTARETARIFAELGEVDFALQILCSTNTITDKPGLNNACPTKSSRIEDMEAELAQRRIMDDLNEREIRQLRKEAAAANSGMSK